ncbi:MAG TPA: translation initiation factor IF-2 associated domain-containing protein [Cellvibrio sp.]|nr:translation initiation factor IF-2 associated domain-containing protein [Cellvibrio sp.]
MTEVTVGELAKLIGAPVERLLKQMQEAGLQHKNAEAKVSDAEKQRLLNFLKSGHNEDVLEPQKITLQRKTTRSIKNGSGNTRKTVNVELRKKRTYVKREDDDVDSNSSSIDHEVYDENILNTAQFGIIELTDPLIPELPYVGIVRNFDDGDAIISVTGLNISVKIENGKFSNIWPQIEEGKSYPEFGVKHQITLSQSDKISTVVRSIEPPVGFAAINLENPVIDDATYLTANFIVAPISGDQVLYVDSECTIFANGGLTCKDPITTRVFHRIEKTGFCYEYNLTIRDAAAEKIKLESIHRSDVETLASDSNEAVNLSQINYTPIRRQLPEAASQEDHLNRQPLISALAAVLAHKANSEHQTIGLLGDWGIGKSTWLKLLKKELLSEHKEQVYLFGEFNAWAYEHTDNLQAGIAQEVIKALSSPAPRLEDIYHDLADQKKESHYSCFIHWLNWKWYRIFLTIKFAVRLNGGELLKLLFVLLLAICPVLLGIPELLSNYLASKSAEQDQALYRGAAFVGNALWFLGFVFYFIKELPKLFANPLAKELLTYLRLPDYAQHLGTIPVMRKNIETLCNIRLKTDSKKPSRLLFVVDDLDRCGHSGIVKVFEAVRLILDIKNVTVIIAVDQHIALAALALHYEEVAKHHKLESPRAIARDYLAKVIHLPIILAHPMRADIESYLQRLWFSSTSKEDHEIVKKEQQDFIQQLAEQKRAELEKQKSASNFEVQNASGLDVDNASHLVSDTALAQENSRESISSSINSEEVIYQEVASLSAAQRRAFIYWLGYFGLTNPRQVKRLNNTYNLLLNCYRDVDKQSVVTELSDPMSQSLFPMMMVLITMEYLNSMEDQKLRNQLRSRLFLRSSAGEEAAHSTALLTNDFMRAFHLLLDARNGLVEKVRPFVLPAIEKC